MLVVFLQLGEVALEGGLGQAAACRAANAGFVHSGSLFFGIADACDCKMSILEKRRELHFVGSSSAIEIDSRGSGKCC